MPGYTAEISHEFQAGPSGPARSYWDVYWVDERGYRAKVGTVVQPPTKGEADFGNLDIPGLIGMLDEAVERGRRQAQDAMRGALGL